MVCHRNAGLEVALETLSRKKVSQQTFEAVTIVKLQQPEGGSKSMQPGLHGVAVNANEFLWHSVGGEVVAHRV